MQPKSLGAEIMPASMTEYRAYTVGLEGRLIYYELLKSHNDADAIAGARLLLRKHPIELWDRKRLVVRLNPERRQER